MWQLSLPGGGRNLPNDIPSTPLPNSHDQGNTVEFIKGLNQLTQKRVYMTHLC